MSIPDPLQDGYAQIEKPIITKEFEDGYAYQYVMEFYKDYIRVDKYEIVNNDMPWVDGYELSYEELLDMFKEGF